MTAVVTLKRDVCRRMSISAWSCELTRHIRSCDLLLGLLAAYLSQIGCVFGGDHPVRPGFQLRSHVNDHGEARKYAMFYPYNISDHSKLPVFIFLNGRGENGDDGIAIGNNFGAPLWEMRDEISFVAIAPQCSKAGAWFPQSTDTQWAFAILDSLIEELNLDANRVYLTGVSSGGHGVWSIASAYPERFAAIVPLCAGGGAIPTALAEKNIPIWNFYNDGDVENLVRFNRETELKLLSLGVSPIVTEYHKPGHDCWNQGYHTKEMYEWVLQQSRDKNRLEAEKFALMNFEKMAHSANGWKVHDEVLSSALNAQPFDCGQFANCFDLHFQVRCSTGEVPGVIIRSTHNPTGFRLEFPNSEEGIGGLFDQAGELVIPFSSRSQRRLHNDRWNEIRIRVETGRISILINGCHACEHITDLSNTETYNVQLLPVTSSSGVLEYRYLRSRPLTWLMGQLQ